MNIKIVNLAAVLLLSFGVAKAMNKNSSLKTILFREDFSSGDSAGKWSLSSADCKISRSSIDNMSGEKVPALLFENKSAGNDQVSAEINFPPVGGDCVLSIWIFPETVAKNGEISMEISPALPKLRMRPPIGKVKNLHFCLDDGRELFDFGTRRWYNLKFVLHKADTLDIIINDEPVIGGISANAVEKGRRLEIDSLKIGVTGASAFYIADLCVIRGTDASFVKAYPDPKTKAQEYPPIVTKLGKKAQAELFVSTSGDDSGTGDRHQPFSSIARAKEAVRAINKNMTGDIYINISGGTYYLSDSIVFTADDSGSNGYDVVYRASGDEKPVLSGGARLAGWELYDREKGIYKCIPGKRIFTRQLFVDGRRAIRARSKNGLADATFDEIGHTSTDLALAEFKNVSDLEMVYKEIWTNPRCGVEDLSVENGKVRIRMKQPGWNACRNKGLTSVKNPWYYENAYELLDEKGEWYLDRTGAVGGGTNAFYYIPRDGENIGQSVIIAPVLENLISINGESLDKQAHNIQFQGIALRHTTWLRPSGENGHADAQNNVIRQDGEFIPDGAAVKMKNANSILFERCEFTNLGGNGLNMYSGCQNNLTRGCVFADISGNGIQVGDYFGFNLPTSENSFWPMDMRTALIGNDVICCYFNHIGRDYRSACAIGAAFPRKMKITGNEIRNVPYGGIHVGWGWQAISRSVSQEIVIRDNYIVNSVAELDDCAAIYTLGPQGSAEMPSFIYGNYVEKSGDHALYFDNGSKWWTARDNVMLRCKQVNINISTMDKYDISVEKTYSDKGNFWNKGTRTCVEKIIIVNNDNSIAVEKIRTNAGLKPPYTGIGAKFEDFGEDDIK